MNMDEQDSQDAAVIQFHCGLILFILSIDVKPRRKMAWYSAPH
jgi:hypothetical protein